MPSQHPLTLPLCTSSHPRAGGARTPQPQRYPSCLPPWPIRASTWCHPAHNLAPGRQRPDAQSACSDQDSSRPHHHPPPTWATYIHNAHAACMSRQKMRLGLPAKAPRDCNNTVALARDCRSDIQGPLCYRPPYQRLPTLAQVDRQRPRRHTPAGPNPTPACLLLIHPPRYFVTDHTRGWRPVEWTYVL